MGPGACVSKSKRGDRHGAALVGLKVLDRFGRGSVSTLIEAVEWCIENKAAYNIRVLSMSLGVKGRFDGTDRVAGCRCQGDYKGICVEVENGFTEMANPRNESSFSRGMGIFPLTKSLSNDSIMTGGSILYSEGRATLLSSTEKQLKDQVRVYLGKCKTLIKQPGKWHIEDRNFPTMGVLGLTYDDVRNMLLNLRVEDYCKTEPDRDSRHPGELWFFKISVPVSVIEYYVKLKLHPREIHVTVISFHPPESQIVRHFQ